MYCNLKVSIWNVMGDDESNQDVLEWNGLQHKNTRQNMMGGNASY